MIATKIKLTTIKDVQEFVKETMMIGSRVELHSNRYVVNAKSILGILSLNLSNPVELIIYNNNNMKLLEKFDKWIVKGE